MIIDESDTRANRKKVQLRGGAGVLVPQRFPETHWGSLEIILGK